MLLFCLYQMWAEVQCMKWRVVFMLLFCLYQTWAEVQWYEVKSSIYAPELPVPDVGWSTMTWSEEQYLCSCSACTRRRLKYNDMKWRVVFMLLNCLYRTWAEVQWYEVKSRLYAPELLVPDVGWSTTIWSEEQKYARLCSIPDPEIEFQEWRRMRYWHQHFNFEL
jgi:hypothetical protein